MTLTGLSKNDVTKRDTDAKAKQTIAELQSYLDSTDWYVTRKMERSIDIPSDVATKRLSAIDQINQLKLTLA